MNTQPEAPSFSVFDGVENRDRVPSENIDSGTRNEVYYLNSRGDINDEYLKAIGQANDTENPDFISKIEGMFRLLDIVSETGSGGLVDKVIIDQNAVARFINHISPGAYTDLTDINFRNMDSVIVKPVGVYGSKSEIIRLMKELNVIDHSTASILSTSNSHTPSDQKIRPGLYALVCGECASQEQRILIIFWPDDETWNDNADSTIRRNRYTFMRYLSKITDQMIGLLSEEHLRSLVWDEAENKTKDDECDIMDSEWDDTDRLFTFEVQKASEQEENVNFYEGFSIIDSRIKDQSGSSELPDGIDDTQMGTRMVSGDHIQGLMTIAHERQSSNEQNFSQKIYNKHQLESYLNDYEVRLSRDLSYEAIEILSTTKLVKSYGDIFCAFLERKKSILEEQKNEKDTKRREMVAHFSEIETRLSTALECYVVNKVVEKHPVLDKKRIYFYLRREAQVAIEEEGENIRFLSDLRAGTGPLDGTLHQLESDDAHETKLPSKLDSDQKDTVNTGFFNSLISIGQKIVGTVLSRKTSEERISIIDESRNVAQSKLVKDLFSERRKILEDWPELNDIVNAALEAANKDYADHIAQRLKSWQKKVLYEVKEDTKNYTNRLLKGLSESKKSESLDKFFKDIEGLISNGIANRNILHIRSLVLNRNFSGEINGYKIVREPDFIGYTVHPLELTEGDRQQLKMNSTYIPKPNLAKHTAFNFRFPLTSSIKLIRLIGDDKCLLVIENREQDLCIYLKELSHLEAAIQSGRMKKKIKKEKIGDEIHLTFDENAKKLLICGMDHGTPSIKLWIYQFNEDYATLRNLGAPIELTQYYPQGIPILKDIHLISGCDEFALVECSGSVKVFSTITQQFRPAVLQLPSPPLCSFTTPDGSCFCAIITEQDQSKFIVYHWASLGSHPGFSYILPQNVLSNQIPIISSLDDKKNIHVMWLDTSNHLCHSIRLDITQQITEFQFCDLNSKISNQKSQSQTVNNSILDCHFDSWSRFPIIPAIHRRTISYDEYRRPPSILFVTNNHSSFPFSDYFHNMIQELEKTTKKPASSVLNQINVSHSKFADMISDLENTMDISSFKSGEWMVDIFCLIPIQIALARDNRFIPIKDGVWSPEFEKSLLGADVGTVSDSLSFGWYESIFRSYMSTKPVKVVSSMGEQSVGKSFALNHLADTSFAGSAMRTTEGVWMSVTPTEDDLIVVLDFEGVHSIERSAQEDTLLVLFNAAISNLVLFRNNFALSRDIANLFQSFQSSSSILDPEANPSLFQSTLDVVDSDRIEITKEFRLKLHKIVQEEQASNFISRLYRGRVDIIPWPVIESRQFYTLFSTLNKKHLSKRSLTPEKGSAFLQKLKMLMAKLKINDWGSMTQNISTHRAQFLLTSLNISLSTGFTEKDRDDEPLKELETGMEIPSEDTDAVFYIDKLGEHQARKEDILKNLIHRWPEFGVRGNEPDQSWTKCLCIFLEDLVEKRIYHVRSWIDINLSGFQQENNSAIEELRRAIDSGIVDLKRGISICKVQCEECRFLCLLPPFHDGMHDCETDHECHFNCEFTNEHDGPQLCSLPAGHEGVHICNPSEHLCGKPCILEENRGCQGNCTKVFNHTDDEHLCSARRHFCAKKCDLINVLLHDGSHYTCQGSCSYLWDENHDQHACDVASCPIACQLCGRLCESTEHLHGLDENTVHLCSQEHKCRSECESIGVCEIDTVPHSIEETFNGAHDQFQYTRYTQVTKRLACAIPLSPGCLKHDGPHIHSTAMDIFHYCDKRCDNCGYVCTLPQGHPQPEHSTNHGSMSRTRWAVEGHNESIEVDSHKFGSNDDGAPMLCNLMCSNLGRHVHIDYCRSTKANGCNDAEIMHIKTRMEPNPEREKDWVTHNLYWRRLGFKDPYSREERSNFAKCDAMCCGDEHKDPPNPSYCDLPHFHPPAHFNTQAPANGHVSNDGHAFFCKNPAILNQAFHVIFVIDRSSSMGHTDRRPLENLPATQRITQVANNRLGAVYTALYSFWVARHAAMNQGAPQNRRDAYSTILFNSSPVEIYGNDFHSTPDQLIDRLLQQQAGRGTDFDAALVKANELMVRYWSPERSPVIIFLSDGECSMTNNIMYDLCRTAIRLGRAVSFHSVSFGSERYSAWLRRMVDIAKEVEGAAPRDPLLSANAIVESSYNVALDSVRLAETFLGIADSLRKTRGGLIRS
ncbi:hypothetical protein PNOK_0440200 [Pyrrhoderma noxium]|uniref:VWFA domain-containing protein n=1 Tax=Pyrrhoderma noxium TaxID=2282107 RepID=A0A286UIT4_9AGAM|nr:hypothetical protein PNOK_0440200 [Pyrrhoderma noxium]